MSVGTTGLDDPKMSNRSDSRISMAFPVFIAIILISISTLIPPRVAEAKSTEYVHLKVTGKSMEPTLTEGDLVEVKLRVDGESINVGDIIVYCTVVTGNPSPEGMWIGHRVVEKYLEDGEYVFRTKGDNVPEVDPWKVPEHFLLGVVVEVFQGYVQTSPSNSSNQPEPAIPYSVAGDLSLGLFLGIFVGLLFIMNKRYSH